MSCDTVFFVVVVAEVVVVVVVVVVVAMVAVFVVVVVAAVDRGRHAVMTGCSTGLPRSTLTRRSTMAHPSRTSASAARTTRTSSPQYQAAPTCTSAPRYSSTNCEKKTYSETNSGKIDIPSPTV